MIKTLLINTTCSVPKILLLYLLLHELINNSEELLHFDWVYYML